MCESEFVTNEQSVKSYMFLAELKKNTWITTLSVDERKTYEKAKERSFCLMGRITNKLRTKMRQRRLHMLSLLAAEAELDSL